MRYDEMPLGVDTLYMFHVVIVVGPWVGGVRTILIHFEDMVYKQMLWIRGSFGFKGNCKVLDLGPSDSGGHSQSTVKDKWQLE